MSTSVLPPLQEPIHNRAKRSVSRFTTIPLVNRSIKRKLDFGIDNNDLPRVKRFAPNTISALNFDFTPCLPTDFILDSPTPSSIESAPKTHLLDLPNELLFNILSMLDGKSMAVLASTNKHIRTILTNIAATKIILSNQLENIHNISKGDSELVLTDLVRRKHNSKWLFLFYQLDQDLMSPPSNEKNIFNSWELVKFINGLSTKDESRFCKSKLNFYYSGNDHSHLLLKYAADTNRVWLLNHLLITQYYDPLLVNFSNLFNLAMFRNKSPDIIIYLIKYSQQHNLLTYYPVDIYNYIMILIRRNQFNTASHILDLTNISLSDLQLELSTDFYLFDAIDSMARKNSIDIITFLITRLGLTKDRLIFNFFKCLQIAGRYDHLEFIQYVVKTLDLNPTRYSERVWALQLLKRLDYLTPPIFHYLVNDYLSRDKNIDFDTEELLILDNVKQCLSSQNNDFLPTPSN